MSLKVVGGRGKKAPYNTVTMRVPADLAPIIESLSDQYKKAIINGKENPLKNTQIKFLYREDLEEIAEAVLHFADRADIALDMFIRELEFE